MLPEGLSLGALLGLPGRPADMAPKEGPGLAEPGRAVAAMGLVPPRLEPPRIPSRWLPAMPARSHTGN